MTTNLSRFVKQERIKQGLGYAELSRKMGYKNFNKGMRRVIDFESDGEVHPDILNRIVNALELDQDHINALVLKDRQEYEEELEKWVSQPIEPYYTLRMMPTIYLSYDMPGNYPTEEQSAEYVAKIAKEKHVKAWLSLSRREKIYITEQGEVGGKIKTTIENVNYPYTRVK